MENSNKIAKKLKIWLHFKLLGWNSPRKSKNKYYRSVPTGCIMENSKKISKILKILKKNHYGVISSQNRLENAEKERK